MDYTCNNLPEYASKYKFIVARKVDNQLWFYGAYSNEFKAETVASVLGDAVVLHNVHAPEKSV